jgi:integrase
MEKLTAKGVDALVARAGRGEKLKEWHPDGENGLALRIRPSGHASFWVRKGGYTPIKVCAVEAGLAHARKEALKIAASRAQGVDPAATRRAAKAVKTVEDVRRDRIGQVVEDYVAKRCKAEGFRSWRSVQGCLRRNVVVRWADIRIGDIDKAMVADLLDGIVDTGKKRQASLVYAHLSSMFKWAVGRGLLEHNIMQGAAKPASNPPRERVLSDEELRLVWLASKRMGYPYGHVVRMLMVSGQRKSEAANAPWAEFDIASKAWTIPKERTKNGRQHTLPLSPLALEILSDVERNNDFLFHTGRPSPATDYARAKTRLDDLIADMNGGKALEHWTLHDLRRTAATRMGDIGVQPHIIECCLNHVGGFRAGVAGTYNKSNYWPEMQDAFARWDARLRQIISGATNVVALPARRA